MKGAIHFAPGSIFVGGGTVGEGTTFTLPKGMKVGHLGMYEREPTQALAKKRTKTYGHFVMDSEGNVIDAVTGEKLTGVKWDIEKQTIASSDSDSGEDKIVKGITFSSAMGVRDVIHFRPGEQIEMPNLSPLTGSYSFARNYREEVERIRAGIQSGMDWQEETMVLAAVFGEALGMDWRNNWKAIFTYSETSNGRAFHILQSKSESLRFMIGEQGAAGSFKEFVFQNVEGGIHSVMTNIQVRNALRAGRWNDALSHAESVGSTIWDYLRLVSNNEEDSMKVPGVFRFTLMTAVMAPSPENTTQMVIKKYENLKTVEVVADEFQSALTKLNVRAYVEEFKVDEDLVYYHFDQLKPQKV